MSNLADRLRYSRHRVITAVDETVSCPDDERVLYAVQLTRRDLEEIVTALAQRGGK